VITKNLKKKDGKGQDLDHTAQIGEEEVDQGQKTGGDESQGQGEYINCLQSYKVIVDYRLCDLDLDLFRLSFSDFLLSLSSFFSSLSLNKTKKSLVSSEMKDLMLFFLHSSLQVFCSDQHYYLLIKQEETKVKVKVNILTVYKVIK
jgi:hypothetical protein